VLEIRDANGRLVARQRVSEFPITLGRAYDNDVILDDAYVSPHHLRLIEGENGEVIAEDLGSVNGMREGSSRASAVRAVVASGGELHLGRTSVRIFDAGHPVPEAVVDRPVAAPAEAEVPRGRRSFAEIFLEPSRARSAWLGAAAVFALRGYLGSTDANPAGDTLSMAIAASLLLAFWAGAWSLGGRLATGRAHFLSHLGWASFGSAIVSLVMIPLSWLSYADPGSEVVGAIPSIAIMALVFVLLAGHGVLASRFSRARAYRRVGYFVIGFGVLATAMYAVREDSYSQSLLYPHTIEPVSTSLLRTESPAAFAQLARKLQKEVDELAGKGGESASGAKAPAKPAARP
jgi:hypothetical protein